MNNQKTITPCRCLVKQWRNFGEYHVEYCPKCYKIETFHWKSFWRRFKNLFIDETLERWKHRTFTK